MKQTGKGEVVLVVGGCRSGKSSHAQELAEGLNGTQNIFIATSEPRDQEMQARVARHQKDRGSLWLTEECPLEVAACIQRFRAVADVLLIDCLTLWVSNLLEHNADQTSVFQAVDQLLTALDVPGCPVFLVGNEVGSGIVPENRVARLFRDLNGFVNQRVAKRADRVIWMVAGLPVLIKKARI